MLFNSKKSSSFATAVLGSVLSATLLISAPAQAQTSKLDEVLKRGHIVVGTGSTNAPWHFIDKKGQLVGFDIDMARLLAKGLFNDPNKVKFIDQSADSRIANLLSNRVDITCQFMTVTAGRAQQVEFAVPYYREGVGILMSKRGKYKNYNELKAAGKKVTVSMLQNVFADEWTKKALPDAKLDQYDSQDLNAQAVMSGRSDGAIIDVSNIRWLIRQEPEKYTDAGYYWQPNNYACAVKRGDSAWLNYVNTALEQAIAGVDFDDYKAAYEKWFGITLPQPKIGAPGQ